MTDGPMPPRHHEINVSSFTCGWADGTRRGCGGRGHKAVNSRPGKVLILCEHHFSTYNSIAASRRVNRPGGEASV